MTFRVSKDPADKAYSLSAWHRRVWHRDQEVTDWITADEFRRVIITPNGILNGSVRIERLPEDAPPPIEAPREVPIDAGFTSGVFVHVPNESKDDKEKDKELKLEEGDPGNESPGVPENVVDEPQSFRLPVGTTQV